jgi:hypothetical protein
LKNEFSIGQLVDVIPFNGLAIVKLFGYSAWELVKEPTAFWVFEDEDEYDVEEV